MSCFYYQILEYSPLANVARNVSPVPVLNCELLNGPEPHRGGVLSFHASFWDFELKVFTGKWEQSLKLVSKAAENSPNMCGVSRDESNFVAQSDEVLKAGLCFSLISLTASLENLGKLDRNLELSSGLHLRDRTLHLVALGRARWEMKHLMPVVRHSQLFLCFWVSDVTNKTWQELIYFSYKCDKIMVEKQNKSSGAGVVFTEFIYLKVFVFFFSLFYFCDFKMSAL